MTHSYSFDKEFEFHEAANIFPLMEEAALKDLAQDIQEHGLKKPIELDQDTDKIIDGRNRYLACKMVEVDPEYEWWTSDESPLDYVVSVNLKRRHLNESQRAMVAANIAKLKKGVRQNSSIDPSKTQKQAAEIMNVSEPSLKRARKVQDSGVAKLSKKVMDGEIAVSTAYEIAHEPKEVQEEIVKLPEKEIVQKAKQIKEKRKQPLKHEKEKEDVKIQRYIPSFKRSGGDGDFVAYMEKCEYGDYVLYTDYEKLKRGVK